MRWAFHCKIAVLRYIMHAKKWNNVRFYSGVNITALSLTAMERCLRVKQQTLYVCLYTIQNSRQLAVEFPVQ